MTMVVHVILTVLDCSQQVEVFSRFSDNILIFNFSFSKTQEK